MPENGRSLPKHCEPARFADLTGSFIAGHTLAREDTMEPHTMTTKLAIIQHAMEDTGAVMSTQRYRTVLASLGLHTCDLETQRWLGLSRRQLIRIHQGHSPVPGPLARLLNLYLRFGLTE